MFEEALECSQEVFRLMDLADDQILIDREILMRSPDRSERLDVLKEL
jgi:hypothetical protein